MSVISSSFHPGRPTCLGMDYTLQYYALCEMHNAWLWNLELLPVCLMRRSDHSTVLSQFCRIRRCWSSSHSPTFVPPPTILPNANNERSFSPSKYCSHYVFLPFYHSTLLLRLRIVVSKIYHISSFFFSCCFPWTLSVRYLFGAIPSDSYNVILSLISIQPFRFTLPVFLNIPLTRQTTVNRLKYTGLLEMVVGVLTTCHTHYTWDTSICIFFI